MRATLKALLIASVVAPIACGDDLSSNPEEGGNIVYTAETKRIQNATINFMSVVVTLRNRTSAHETRTYPAACPVQIRLYRLGDDALVYDETQRPCPSEPVATIAIDGLATRELQSGLRTPASILGDSLAVATYGVRAYVRTEGTKEILVHAGTVTF